MPSGVASEACSTQWSNPTAVDTQLLLVKMFVQRHSSRLEAGCFRCQDAAERAISTGEDKICVQSECAKQPWIKTSLAKKFVKVRI